MKWTYTEDPTDPCAYCVQWRYRKPDGTVAYDHDLGGHPPQEWKQEPYWPDDSVPERVHAGICNECAAALAAMHEFNDANP